MKRARKDSGFALLLVFLIAAVIAINLMLEMPRVAVESQRQKEQLLIVRGEEYKRAILVFYKATNRWPAKIEDLENTNNRHFLRRRYVDPMTGKDEWRFIHIQNGIFTDSLVNKPKTNNQQQQGDGLTGQYVAANQGMFDPGNTGTTAGPNLGRRRVSDGGTGGGMMMSDPNAPNTAANGNMTAPPPIYPQPGEPGATGATDNPSGVPGAVGTSAGPSGPVPGPTAPGLNPDGSMPGMPVPPGLPGMIPPGVPGSPGMPVNSQTGGVSAMPYSTAPGANGAPVGFMQPGQTAPTGPTSAAGIIGQLLSSPRPGGPPMGTLPDGSSMTAGGAFGGVQGGAFGGTGGIGGTVGTPIGGPITGSLTIGGGIAGVASKMDQEGIMVYNDRTNYKEWEFIFDPSKWRPPANPLSSSVPAGTPASQMGSMPQGVGGTPASSMGNMPQGLTGTTGMTSPTGH